MKQTLNPSIERTSPGKSGVDSHLKHYAFQTTKNYSPTFKLGAPYAIPDPSLQSH